MLSASKGGCLLQEHDDRYSDSLELPSQFVVSLTSKIFGAISGKKRVMRLIREKLFRVG